MSSNLLWFLFAYLAWEARSQIIPDPFGESGSSSSSGSESDSLSFSILDDFEIDSEPFVLVRNMIEESRSIVTRILQGKIPPEVRAEAKQKQPKIVRFLNGVSRMTKECLKKFKSQAERLRNAAKCFAEAVKNRQNEEEEGEEEEVSPVQSCLQESMIETAGEAAPLMAEAQELYVRFRKLMSETGRNMMACREDVRPFDCMRTVWTEATTEMAEMREEAVEMMYRAREIYMSYMDSMKYCMTPVEQPDQEPEEEEYDEEKLATTEVTKCLNGNEYDSVQSEQETRPRAINICDEKPAA